MIPALPVVSLSLPGLAPGAYAFGLAAALLLAWKLLRRARDLANVAFDGSEAEETLCATFLDPVHPSRRRLLPLERDEAGPVTVPAPDLGAGEKCVLRWREGALRRAYAVDILPTGIPVDPGELPEAFAAAGGEEPLDPRDLERLLDREVAGGATRTPTAAYPFLPVVAGGASAAATLLAAAAGLAALAAAFLFANAALDPTAGRRVPAGPLLVREGPFGLVKLVRVSPPGAASFTTAVPAALARFPVDGTLLVDRRPGFFRLPWVAGVSVAAPAAPRPAPPRAELPEEEPSPGEIPGHDAARRLRREAFAVTDPTRSLALVARLERAGALPLALDLAESYAEVFADDPDFLFVASRIARALGEEPHARHLLGRGKEAFPDDKRFR